MSQKIIYEVLKNDLGGSGTTRQIKQIVQERYPHVSLLTISDKISRMRKWGCIDYHYKNSKVWFICGEFDPITK